MVLYVYKERKALVTALAAPNIVLNTIAAAFNIRLLASRRFTACTFMQKL